jgi:thiamine pyrophosphate-dependent acetolactate synthase large subunit-like protein
MGDVFGCRGEKVTRDEDLAPALQRALQSDQTTVLNIITDPAAGLERKKDPRLQMVTFEDLQVSLKAHHAPAVA